MGSKFSRPIGNSAQFGQSLEKSSFAETDGRDLERNYPHIHFECCLGKASDRNRLGVAGEHGE